MIIKANILIYLYVCFAKIIPVYPCRGSLTVVFLFDQKYKCAGKLRYDGLTVCDSKLL